MIVSCNKTIKLSLHDDNYDVRIAWKDYQLNGTVNDFQCPVSPSRYARKAVFLPEARLGRNPAKYKKKTNPNPNSLDVMRREMYFQMPEQIGSRAKKKKKKKPGKWSGSAPSIQVHEYRNKNWHRSTRCFQLNRGRPLNEGVCYCC
jgi:hypothetical protein